NVGVLGAEELLGAVARQVLDDVGKLATSVVALSRISLGILVGKHRALRLEYGLAHKVFRGDKLQPVMLAAAFAVNRIRNEGIDLVKRAGHRVIFHEQLSVL